MGRATWSAPIMSLSLTSSFLMRSFRAASSPKRRSPPGRSSASLPRARGTLFIDRTRKRAVLEIADAMRGAISEGTNVLFFPEGTTGNGLELLPFHPNLFEAAVRSGAEILPVTLRYTLDGKPSGLVSYAGNVALFTVLKRILFTPGLGVEVTVLDPIAAAGKTRQALCLETSALMSASLGVADATAQREAMRLRRLQAMSERQDADQAI